MRLMRSEEHTSELQSHSDLVCRLLLEKKKRRKKKKKKKKEKYILDKWKVTKKYHNVNLHWMPLKNSKLKNKSKTQICEN